MEPLREHRLMAGHDELRSGAGFGQAMAHGQRVAGVGERHVGDGGPHGALVRVGAADPTAEQEMVSEEFLAHRGALGSKGVRDGVRWHSSVPQGFRWTQRYVMVGLQGKMVAEKMD